MTNRDWIKYLCPYIDQNQPGFEPATGATTLHCATPAVNNTIYVITTVHKQYFVEDLSPGEYY